MTGRSLTAGNQTPPLDRALLGTPLMAPAPGRRRRKRGREGDAVAEDHGQSRR